jgi:hypothetical protein
MILAGALALQILFLNAADNDKQKGDYDQYQIPAAIMNALVIMYLLFYIIYYRPYSSGGAIALASFLLIVGFITEIYLTVYEQQYPNIIGTYFVVSMNSIIRLYMLIQIHCDKPLTTIPSILQEAARVASVAAKPISDATKPVGRDLATIDPERAYGNVLNAISQTLASVGATLTDEQRIDMKSKIANAVGKTPKIPQPPPTGGRRRR